MAAPDDLGSRLRHLRKARQLTLNGLAKLSGVSVSTISKIENGALSPTLDKLLRLADGLELTVGQLIGEDDSAGAIQVPNSRFSPSRVGDGVVIDTPNYEYRYLCSDLTNKRMMPIHATIKASSLADFGPLEQHGGEEFLVVIAGEIEVHSEFYAPVTLKAGESIYLDSTMGHAYLNTGGQDAEVFCICTEPQRLQVGDEQVSDQSG